MSLIEPILERTARPIARILPAGAPVGPLGSRLLGSPYLPRGRVPPPPRGGGRWAMMAQIDFSELPAGIDPDFPERGILQLFFDTRSTMGMDFDAPLGCSGFLALFHPDPDASLHDPAAADLAAGLGDEGDEALFPLSEPRALAFELSEQTVLPTDDAALARMPEVEAALSKLPERARDDWHDFEKPPFTQVGGYAYFTQQDPREPALDWALLLQLDTDDRFGMMWGDSGVANLSIPREALRARDFSRCLFNWDCC